MKREVQLRLMKQLLEAADEPSRLVEAETTPLSADRYTDPGQLERERRALFEALPVLVAHESELPEPGDFVTERLFGAPLLVVRGSRGQIGVFMNACRHRGALLVDAPCGRGQRALTCPYHAWSYRTDGSLFHVPQQEAFGDGLKLHELGLLPVAHEVRHGFIWVRLKGEGTLDVRRFLGPVLDEDLESFGLAEHRVAEQRTHNTEANWKLVMDAFAEGYHLKSLHQQSLARFFLDLVIVEDCAPHVRQVGARKTLLKMKETSEECWNLREQTTVFYNLFPNTVMVFHPEWVSVLSLVPRGVGQVEVRHRMMVPGTIAGDAQVASERAAKWAKSFALIDGQVFAKEDLAIAERIQATLGAGADTQFRLGGLERGMRLFHEARDAAISA